MELSRVSWILVCAECGAESEGAARGWRAYVCDLDDDGQDDILCFCPICAEREAGAR